MQELLNQQLYNNTPRPKNHTHTHPSTPLQKINDIAKRTKSFKEFVDENYF